MRPAIKALIVVVVSSLATANAQISTDMLRPVGYHPSNIAYYNTPYFSNALWEGGEWYSFTNSEFGTALDFNALPSQFINGYPQFLNSGQKLRALIFGLNIQDPFRPSGWPDREKLARGHIVVTWQGNADVRLVNGTFVSGESNGAATGTINNGRRVYLCTSAGQSTQSIEVHAITTPITQMRVWLAPVDDPATAGVNENLTGTLEGQMFHPLLLQRIADRDWGFIRFMDWGATNASPQQDWSDRRSPNHIFMAGIINDRSPSATSEGDRETGVAFEYMVALCNATNKNLWINIPHLATADFMTKLAQLIRFGSDGVNPYTSTQANPVFAPLNSNLKVFVEFSNEIWSSGFSFAQGNWAEEQAALLPAGTFPSGEEKARFNARKFCDSWRIFQNVFGGTSRLVRVAATFTALQSYTTPFLQEMGSYGPTLSPAVRPDVLAITTYFGNDIQGYVNTQGFATGKLFNDAYWSSATFASDLTKAFDEWKRRILAGDSASGSGPDATGIGGGFSSSLRTLPNTLLGYSLPLIAYEGGPSLFTNEIDLNATNGSGVPTDDGVTTFVEAMNRDSRMADVYRIHLEIAKSKGLWTHNPYTDTSPWSRFGQWGHLETIDQTPASAPKYQLMFDHFTRFTSVRHIDTPLNNVPSFVTDAILPVGIAGQTYTTDITTTGGDGARTATVVGSFLDGGLIVTTPSAGTIRISGSPGLSRKNYLLVCVTDADGDPAWRIFTLETFGGPGTLVQSDFRGTNPALNLPWTPTFVLSPKVSWSGWSVGAGIGPASGNNALVFSVSAPSAADETLTQAISDNEFLKATTTVVTGPLDLRAAQVRFSTKRIGFHSPRGYALFCGLTGFAEANALYVSAQVSKDNSDDTEHVVTLPSTATFQSIATSTPIEWRIYAYGAQFDGHTTSLTAFKLTQDTSGSPPTAPGGLTATAQTSTQVLLTWNAVANAANYEVMRRNGGSETSVGTPGAATFTDITVSPDTSYIYRVRAVGAGGTSGFSNSDIATTVVFTDDALAATSTAVKRTHLLELRTAINALRATAGLGTQTFTDSTINAGSTNVRAVHVTDMRTGLNAALSALSFSLPSYANTISAGAIVRAIDFQELRNAVK